MQVQQSNLNKRNENKNNDNSTLKKINWPVALPGRSPSHPAGDRRDVRRGGGGGAESRCRGWRVLHGPDRPFLDEHTGPAVGQTVFRGGARRVRGFFTV